MIGENGDKDGNLVSEILRGVELIGKNLVSILENMVEIQRGKVQADVAREKERDIRDEIWRETGIEMIERKSGEMMANKVKCMELQLYHLEKIRVALEQGRRLPLLNLPIYCGDNYGFDEWVEKIKAVKTCNGWDQSMLLRVLPTSLEGRSKRAFDSLSDDVKADEKKFIANMRMKLDTWSKEKNKELFITSIRENEESNHSFANRLRMYIRRNGNDPEAPWAEETIGMRVRGQLKDMSPVDIKVINATIGKDLPLDEFLSRVDLIESECAWGKSSIDSSANMKTAQIPNSRAGTNSAEGREDGVEGETCRKGNDDNGARAGQVRLKCGKCKVRGHRRKDCKNRDDKEEDDGADRGEKNKFSCEVVF